MIYVPFLDVSTDPLITMATIVSTLSVALAPSSVYVSLTFKFIVLVPFRVMTGGVVSAVKPLEAVGDEGKGGGRVEFELVLLIALATPALASKVSNCPRVMHVSPAPSETQSSFVCTRLAKKSVMPLLASAIQTPIFA